MSYRELFARAKNTTIKAALVGSGEFGASFVFQAFSTPGLKVSAICTRTVSKAVAVYQRAGVPPENIVICNTEEEVQLAYKKNKYIVTDDCPSLLGLPLDILVEGSGSPEAGSHYASNALEAGINVVMVSKEVDSVVGPILNRIALEKGLVYSTVEGDQPSLLIGLITWAESLGLDIVCAGKSSEYDFVVDLDNEKIAWQSKEVSALGIKGLWDIKDGTDSIRQRSELLDMIPQRSVPDLCEMVIVANNTGFEPASSFLNATIARIVELPDILGLENDGGITIKPKTIDIFNCLRRDDEPSMAGGVFILVACHDKDTWKVLAAKGHPVSKDNKYALLYRPAHLLGVEAPISVLSAILLKQPTGTSDLKPRYDLVASSIEDIPAGTIFQVEGHHHTIEKLDALIHKNMPVKDGNPVPFYMLAGAKTKIDIPAGSTITLDMVEISEESPLWKLRILQDEKFP